MSTNVKRMTFLPRKKTVDFSGSPSVLEVAIENEIPLNHSCGGMGSCTTCLVKVKVGLAALGPRNELEAEHAQMREFNEDERLACQVSASDGLVVVIPGGPIRDARKF
jgi:2Fe-2S ferredoxin